jgi:uncharacterized membrane protein
MGNRSHTLLAARDKGSSAVAIQSSEFPPVVVIDTLERYNPGSADRTLKMVEADQTHKHAIERRIATIPFVAMWFGFILCLSLLLIGAFLIYLEKNLGGYASLGAALCMLVGNLYAQNKQKK